MRFRSPVPSDNVGAPCSCLECQAAGVTHRPIIRVPADDRCSTPHWLHGDALKAWYEARDRARDAFRAMVAEKGMS